jgi:signal peptide peptidase SppA
MANKLNPFLARFDTVPAMVAPEMRGIFEASLHQVQSQMNSPEFTTAMSSADDNWWGEPGSFRSMIRPYIVKDGILHIPIKGVLLHDFPFQFGSWATGYEYIWKAFERGMSDGSVRGIALICDSPGGEVAGNFDLVDKMFAMRGTKPIRGYASESAYSACYSIISVADPGQVYVSRTGGVGSIGVVTMHVDVSKLMDDIGYKITFIYAGKHKVDGNAYEALDPEVKARIQTRIDELYGVFVSTVARNRAMSEEAVRATEALTFTATQAVSNGLADAIGSLEDAVAAFAADLSLEDEDEKMTEEEKKAAALAVENAKAEGIAAGKAEGSKEGASAMRGRIEAIVSSEDGKKRPTLALKMATGEKFASLDAETVIGMLAEMPEEKAEAAAAKVDDPNAPKGKSGAGADFAAAMEKSGNPELAAALSEDDSKPSRAEAALARVKGPKAKAA